jgi:hypothetical protein
MMERWGIPDWAGWATLVLLIILAEGAMALYTVKRRQERNAYAARGQQTVLRAGAQATAVILRTMDTGTRLGADQFFVWKLTLAVRHAAQGSFETEIRVPISPARFGDFAEGREILVRVDGRTRDVVVAQRTE